MPSFAQVVVAQGFSCSPSSNPQKSSRDAVDEGHARALCLLSQQKAGLAVPVPGDCPCWGSARGHVSWLSTSPCPGLTLTPSRQLRCRKPRSCNSAPPCSFNLPSRSSPREGPHQHSQAALTPMWPPALWRAEDAHHLHVPLLQPPLQPCPGWGDVVPSSSLADVRSHHHPQTMAEPLVPSATGIQSIHAPCFCKEGN